MQLINLVNLDNSKLSQTVEFTNYARDSNKLNMQDQELDAVIKLEVYRADKVVSWEAFDDRYGRVVAY